MIRMTEEWVSLWYFCLSRNMDYSIYCSAREAGKGETVAEIERRFGKIKDIYSDFGTLETITELIDIEDKNWKEWFEPREHLFLPKVEKLSGQLQKTRDGYLPILVPLLPNREETVQVVSDFLSREYAEEGKVFASSKYQLKSEKGAFGLERVKTCCRIVGGSYQYDLETFEELSAGETIKAIVLHESGNLGWQMGVKEREELLSGGMLSPERFESAKAVVNRARRDFTALSANTIRASFPAHQSYDSEVQADRA